MKTPDHIIGAAAEQGHDLLDQLDLTLDEHLAAMILGNVLVDEAQSHYEALVRAGYDLASLTVSAALAWALAYADTIQQLTNGDQTYEQR